MDAPGDFISLNDSSSGRFDATSNRSSIEFEDVTEKRQMGASTRIPPWIRRKYSADRVLALHEEVSDFASYIEATPEEMAMRMDVVKRVEQVVHSLWPKATVQAFGSSVTGLCLPTSDVDIVVCGEWVGLPLRTLARALKNNNIPTILRVIDKARVPIIKFRDGQSMLDVDICFNQSSGVEDTVAVKEMLELSPCIKPIVLIIKQFLLQRGMHEVFSGGLGSYSVFLMVLSFIQLHPRPKTMNKNIGVLLTEFFELFGKHFNYEEIAISVKNGGCYFRKEDRDFEVEFRPMLLSIENPTTGDDVTRNSYAMPQIRSSFEHAYYVLCSMFTRRSGPRYDNNPKDSLLSNIISIDDDVHDYRQWVKTQWNSARASAHRMSASRLREQDLDTYEELFD